MYEVCLRAQQNSFCVKSDMAHTLSASSSASFGLFTGLRFTHLCWLVACQWIFHQYSCVLIAVKGNGCHWVCLLGVSADVKLWCYFKSLLLSSVFFVLTFTLQASFFFTMFDRQMWGFAHLHIRDARTTAVLHCGLLNGSTEATSRTFHSSTRASEARHQHNLLNYSLNYNPWRYQWK